MQRGGRPARPRSAERRWIGAARSRERHFAALVPNSSVPHLGEDLRRSAPAVYFRAAPLTAGGRTSIHQPRKCMWQPKSPARSCAPPIPEKGRGGTVLNELLADEIPPSFSPGVAGAARIDAAGSRGALCECSPSCTQPLSPLQCTEHLDGAGGALPCSLSGGPQNCTSGAHRWGSDTRRGSEGTLLRSRSPQGWSFPPRPAQHLGYCLSALWNKGIISPSNPL